MEVGIHANMCDQATSRAAKALHTPFRELSALLQGEYGGVIEHLWIDLELIERGGPAQLDRNPVFLSDISAGYAAAASSGWLK
jgi:hypothetical protein